MNTQAARRWMQKFRTNPAIYPLCANVLMWLQIWEENCIRSAEALRT